MPKNKERRTYGYRYCFVPGCKSTTVNTPEKRFFNVPKRDGIREKWLNTCRRKHGAKSSVFYCCEDHFDLEKDVSNMVQHQLVGRALILKEGVLPSRFECQKQPQEQPQKDKGSPSKRHLSVQERKKVMRHILDSYSRKDEEKLEKKPKVAKKEYNFDLEVEPHVRMTPVTSLDLIVQIEPTAFITPDIESSDILGPDTLLSNESDSSMMEQDISKAMTCENYPADNPQPDFPIKIKVEPLDPDIYQQEIPSVTVKQEPDGFSGESSLTSIQGSLFQPPALIKEEPISSEEEL